MHRFEFPKTFFWGCSTSAHQIEGSVLNDWSEWEKSQARLEELKNKQKAEEEFISGQACDSWNRFHEDIECLKQLGVNSYRFSIEWSRIEPIQGQFDIKALDRYKQFIESLRANNIEPFVTLWHWPIPLWVRDQGGWLSKQTVEHFAAYSQRVVEHMGELVTYWITLNEPMVYATHSYKLGIWPPQHKSLSDTIRVAHHLVEGHNAASVAIKSVNPKALVGLSKHNIHFSAKQPLLINQLMAKVSSYFWNEWFLNRTVSTSDFIGVNYYFQKSIDIRFGKNDRIRSDLGWELYPEGLEKVLLQLKRYKKPVYITEHGLADKDDRHRTWYLKESLKHAHNAMRRGVDLRGYFHWSLLDNFEWAEGFMPRFGLFEVDRATCKRTARASVQVYHEIIKNNAVE